MQTVMAQIRLCIFLSRIVAFAASLHTVKTTNSIMVLLRINNTQTGLDFDS